MRRHYSAHSFYAVILQCLLHLSSCLSGADEVDVAHSAGRPVTLPPLHPAGQASGYVLQRLIHCGAAGAAQQDTDGNTFNGLYSPFYQHNNKNEFCWSTISDLLLTWNIPLTLFLINMQRTLLSSCSPVVQQAFK